MSQVEIGIPGDHVIHHEMKSMSLAVPQLWDIEQANLKSLWEKGIDGRGVNIAVMDTGYSPHPNLPTPLYTKDYTGSRNGMTDMNSHGSWCNGRTVGRGGVGCAPGAGLLHIKVLSDNGSGRVDWSMAGRVKAAEHGAHITSVSLGGGCMNNSDVPNSMFDANRFGNLLEVDAAGNAGYNGSNTISCPGKYLSGFAVGAYRRDGTISNFSSGGREIDVATPGERVTSTSNNGTGWTTMSGTSMATPFFAGIMALVVQARRQRGTSDDAMKGALAWREWFAQEGLLQVGFEDAGQPGKDVRYGLGKPSVTNIIAWLKDYVNI